MSSFYEKVRRAKKEKVRDRPIGENRVIFLWNPYKMRADRETRNVRMATLLK